MYIKLRLPLAHLHFLSFMQLVRRQLKHIDIVKTKVARSIVLDYGPHKFGLLNPYKLICIEHAWLRFGGCNGIQSHVSIRVE